MKQMPAQRERRKKDYERVLTLFASDSFAKDKRTKVQQLCRGAMHHLIISNMETDLALILFPSGYMICIFIFWGRDCLEHKNNP